MWRRGASFVSAHKRTELKKMVPRKPLKAHRSLAASIRTTAVRLRYSATRNDATAVLSLRSLRSASQC
jgi:hypothetical protein